MILIFFKLSIHLARIGLLYSIHEKEPSYLLESIGRDDFIQSFRLRVLILLSATLIDPDSTLVVISHLIFHFVSVSLLFQNWNILMVFGFIIGVFTLGIDLYGAVDLRSNYNTITTYSMVVFWCLDLFMLFCILSGYVWIIY